MHRRTFLPMIPALALTACGDDAVVNSGPGSYEVPVRTPAPDEAILYKQVASGNPLELHVFKPENWNAGDARSAIVFFFGGGWRTGTPVQYYQQCRYLATRGMMAVSAVYRTTNSHGSTPFDSLRDAKSAVRYVRQQSAALGIHPDRITTSGGSAGGHLAVSTAIIPGYEDEVSSVSSEPNAMVLFNPVLDLDKQPYHLRLGIEWQSISPAHHIRSGLPPAVMLHGTADVEAPYEDAVAFTSHMQQSGNDCTLVSWEGKEHAWYNYGREPDLTSFRETLRAADEFLVRHGFLSGDPTI